ncbi:hypothetical protein HDU76_007663 [Blyttiomyces sp. JEL0837]|nr:hypothetical protein HDU76_007663 [Blyttiomyces sp. JEL0837]
MVFSKEELATVNFREPIFELNSKDGRVCFAEWLLFDGEVRGVQLSCSTGTCKTPSTCIIRFAWPEIPDHNGPRAVSVTYPPSPRFGELPLSKNFTYNLPKEPLHKGPRIDLPNSRKRDTSLPTWNSPETKLKLKVLETYARHNTSSDNDSFNVDVLVMNTSNEDMTVMEARGFIKLRTQGRDPELPNIEDGITLNSTTWQPITECYGNGEAVEVTIPAPPVSVFHQQPGRFGGGFRPPQPPPMRRYETPSLPLRVSGGGTLKITVRCVVSTKRYNGGKLPYGTLGYSWLGVQTGVPILLDLELEDVNGGKFGGIVEFPVASMSFPKPDTDDIFFLTCDDTTVFERLKIAAKTPELPDKASSETSQSSHADDVDSAKLLRFQTGTNVAELTTWNMRHFVVLAEREFKGGDRKAVVLDVSKILFSERALSDTGDDVTERKDLIPRFGVKALIDLSRRVVYAFRVEMVTNSSRAAGFCKVPEYGDCLRAGELEGVDAGGVDGCDVSMEEVRFKWDVPGDASVVRGALKDSTGVEQGMEPVEPRVSFDKETAGKGVGGTGVGTIDPAELAKALLPLLTSEIRVVVKEVVKEELAGVVESVTARLREEFSNVAKDVVVEGVRNIVDEQSVRLEKVVTESASTSVADTVRQVEQTLGHSASKIGGSGSGAGGRGWFGKSG